MFKKILIANRGEIALRIIRACREMGISPVAVYSTADKDSLHVKLADESYCIGNPDPASSYLNIPAIISAAEISDSEAIHPGYGFLAENANFAEICESCKITFIGPKADTIELVGDKSKAKHIMKKAGVPVIPGDPKPVEDPDQAVNMASKIGYPVIIKASAGGGGRGMRVAHTDASLVNFWSTARAEAEKAFGDPTVYMEKFIEDPKHVEVQLLGDNFKNIIYLGERECTIQRRHQKLIEEAPCPVLTPAQRKKLGEAAVKGAKAVNYRSAGTMEFLLDRHGKFYFMEMNTRVQVEHPVTEAITGIDIIKEQISIAAGKKLSVTQKDVKPKGHAIECRINAENPEMNFAPSPGRITSFILPGGMGVRNDTHAYEGYMISPHYDSMIGKLILYGRDRDEAIRVAMRALSEFHVEGIHTTIPVLHKIISSHAFQKGEIYTNFIEKFFSK